jgi:hypothetical protein|eukprot:COSAG01_NODE_4945_length_4602_cov_5.799023_2_plen_67_part_00
MPVGSMIHGCATIRADRAAELFDLNAISANLEKAADSDPSGFGPAGLTSLTAAHWGWENTATCIQL